MLDTPLPNHMVNLYCMYTLPSRLQEKGQIGILDMGVTNYALEYYAPQLLENWRDKRHRWRLERC